MADFRMIDPPVPGPFAGVPKLEAWRKKLLRMPNDDVGVQLARRQVDRWLVIARRLAFASSCRHRRRTDDVARDDRWHPRVVDV
jgi:hypothetical protein